MLSCCSDLTLCMVVTLLNGGQPKSSRVRKARRPERQLMKSERRPPDSCSRPTKHWRKLDAVPLRVLLRSLAGLDIVLSIVLGLDVGVESLQLGLWRAYR